jgi:hypothetical protein
MDRVKFFWALQLSLAIRDGERQGIQWTKGRRRHGSWSRIVDVLRWKGLSSLGDIDESFEDFELQRNMSGPVSRTWFRAADLNSDWNRRADQVVASNVNLRLCHVTTIEL